MADDGVIPSTEDILRKCDEMFPIMFPKDISDMTFSELNKQMENNKNYLDAYSHISSYTNRDVNVYPINFYYYISYATYFEFLLPNKKKKDPEEYNSLIRDIPYLKKFALYLRRNNIELKNIMDCCVHEYMCAYDVAVHPETYPEHIDIFEVLSVSTMEAIDKDKKGAKQNHDNTAEQDFFTALDDTIKDINIKRFMAYEEIYKNKEKYENIKSIISEIKTNLDSQDETVNGIAINIAEALSTSDDQQRKSIMESLAEIMKSIGYEESIS